MTLFVAVMLPLVTGLGVWQVQRAAEKRAFEDRFLARITALPVVPGPAVEDFQRLKLVGEYEPGRDFLLDNQTRRGAVGFDVVSSFRTEDGRRWLVNRGFLPGDRARRSLPAVRSPRGTVTLVGLVWPELGLLPVLGDDPWAEGWPKVIQQMEVGRMAADLGGAVPREIRLEAGQPGVFAAATTRLNMPSSQHTGYAVQWFGLATALLAGWLFFGFRKRGDEHD